MVLLLLNGLKNSNEQFNDIVKSLRGSLKSPAHEDYVADKGLTKLDLVRRYASTLKSTYVNLVQSKQWEVSSSSGDSFFPAVGTGSVRKGGVNPSSNSASQIIQPGFQKPRPDWQNWYRSQICDHHCGGPHPSKYHGDQGIYNRPFKPKQRTPNKKPKSGFNFKSKDSKTEFKKRVYQAMFDCIMEGVDFEMPSD
eukprot:scaffold31189_cov72-Cyclotella_meneghiniana.AAC.3